MYVINRASWLLKYLFCRSTWAVVFSSSKHHFTIQARNQIQVKISLFFWHSSFPSLSVEMNLTRVTDFGVFTLICRFIPNSMIHCCIVIKFNICIYSSVDLNISRLSPDPNKNAALEVLTN